MNEETIEELLRKAPGVNAPAGLLQELQRDIRLPGFDAARANRLDSRPWLRRWLPALSFAAILFACLVAIGVQTNILSELQRENGTLRATAQNLGQLRTENEEYRRLQGQSQDLERLRKDNAELHRLQNEVTQLRAQIQDLEKLRAENQKLRAAISAVPGIPGKNLDDALAKEKAKDESIRCAGNLKQIGAAAKIWAGDNNNVFPSNFISMTNQYLSAPLILWCPSDKSRRVASCLDARKTTSPPLPPSPPSGPPFGTNFSCRKLITPLPPLPACT